MRPTFSPATQFASHLVENASYLDLPAAELKLIVTAAKKRQQQFSAGRMAARAALSNLDANFADSVILKDDAGQALWPAGVCGSITHAGPWALAAVSLNCNTAVLGLDLESLTRQVDKKLANRICSEHEIRWLNNSEDDYQQSVLAVFSAKESVYKAFYPHCRRFLNYLAVELTPTTNRCVFSARLTETISQQFPENFEFVIRYALDNEFVLTWVEIPTCAPQLDLIP